ncbi:uncharacterized protein PHALS_14543 [Plasmopara halstedii]|uniref:Uncharacterized protein n=1 Tax=Plasmopara halstedii TaxID=4781 RepID=A0A0P1AKF5_PLAHL|nr:uncharacterized protein PHALS_14543 [Plasmopara halstedii]CEG41591.1 hypothetical protein PHALS_14543 [Plasmopara halstedii]|eukprot:XP_024577960.1 hypothetical protein PHALS_14543 [Plasmopara halstedii]
MHGEMVQKEVISASSEPKALKLETSALFLKEGIPSKQPIIERTSKQEKIRRNRQSRQNRKKVNAKR